MPQDSRLFRDLQSLTNDAGVRTKLGLIGAADTHAHAQHTNRTRTIWIPAGDFAIREGTPALAVRGTSLLYSAWALDAASTEGVLAEYEMPQDTVTGTITLRLYVTNLGAGSGDIRHLYSVFRSNDGVNMDSGFTTIEDTGTTVTAPAQNVLDIISVVTANTVSAGDHLTFLYRRQGALAADTLGNDSGFVGLAIDYTADG